MTEFDLFFENEQFKKYKDLFKHEGYIALADIDATVIDKILEGKAKDGEIAAMKRRLAERKKILESKVENMPTYNGKTMATEINPNFNDNTGNPNW
eukprot:CAMPEP_0206178174 /NCGR_PEP_ID=MMETSP1474-20131121/63435_1 /ASSEMBLY_ACC=CAM_ASM_001110 /TAXON_ID=97495 /ORGANISM="Imantonia sp., Strain RCC918" /LENGTH=95 /DNA_ID=CAMNT_0053590479 /DNA_START=41 /DNA_END=325 /DNA_ORIENTATION=-